MPASSTTKRKMFSIILATSNSGRKVENTVRSVLAQNKELFELIVVDNASSDETLECLKKYENDLTLISEPDAGVYDAFNKGIDRATGEYLYFIGAGDCLRVGILEEIKDFLPLDAPALVYGKYYLMRQKHFAGVEIDADFLVCDNICHQAVFYRRDVFDIVGKYDLRFRVRADWALNLRCFTEPAIVKLYVPHVIADFEEGGLSSIWNNDPAFMRHFPDLVKERLGVRLYLISKAFMRNPTAIYLTYGFLYAAQRKLSALSKSSAYGYERLKKVFSR